jgi:uncharacterized membrane protein YebE (DUF533 family)
MAKRHRRYSLRNQLGGDDTELIVGGLIAVGVVGLAAYMIYRSSQTSTAANAGSVNTSTDPTAQQLGVPSGLTTAQTQNLLSGDYS